MLQEMRKYTKSWIANIFLGALTLSFVSWGIGDIFLGRTSTSVATVGDSSIDQQTFQRDYSNVVRSEGEQRGKPLSVDEARREHLGEKVLDQTISRVAIDNVVQELGLTASDAQVADEIRSIPAFAGITGSFDRQVFQQRISRFGYTEQGFSELVRNDLARSQLVNATEGGFLMPPGYARALFAYSTEIRAAEYITVDPKVLPPIAPPPDSVLAAYVKAHPERYSTPEYRDVTYAEITPQDVMSGVNITDAQIQKVYDDNKDKYVLPEKRDVERLDFPNEAAAKAAKAKIDSGTAFDQEATALGKKPADISLGEVVKEDLDPAESQAAFALPANGVSQPVKGPSGWALLHVTKIVAGQTTTLAQASNDIRQQLVQETAQSKLVDIANAYTDASSSGLSLTAAAKKVGMHSGHVAAMDKNGLTPDGSKAAVPDDPDFRALVFHTEVGEEGDPEPAKSGNYYVVSVNGLVPPKLKPLDQVRAQAVADWTGEQRAIQLRKKAEELAAQANQDKSLAAAAKSIGAAVQNSPALTHATHDATFSTDLITKLFDAMPGQAVFGPAGNGGDYVVARVSGILHPLPPVNDPSYAQGVRLISGGVGSGITDTYAAALRAKFGVKINTKLLNSVVGGEGS